MPGRKTKLVNNHYYHIVNRGVSSQDLFLDFLYYSRAIETLKYYKHSRPPIKFSRFIKLSGKNKFEIFQKLESSKEQLVEILAYTLMPNHIHLVIKQVSDNGISTFMSKYQNSFTRFFNLKNKRKGHIFQSAFRSAYISDEEQLLHVIRYVLLNAYSAGIIDNLKDIKSYPFSCFGEYLDPKYKRGLCSTAFVMGHFGSVCKLEKFVFDNADYQKKLQDIKRILLET